MKKIIIAMAFISSCAFAGTTNPASNYQFKAGYDIGLTQGDITLTDGDMTFTDGLTIRTPTSAVIVSTSVTMATITNGFTVIRSSGSDKVPVFTLVSAATPFISTSTAVYALGTEVTIMCSSGTVTISDNGTVTNSCLSLGATTRSLAIGDIIKLVFTNIAGVGHRWKELSFTDCQ